MLSVFQNVEKCRIFKSRNNVTIVFMKKEALIILKPHLASRIDFRMHKLNLRLILLHLRLIKEATSKNK